MQRSQEAGESVEQVIQSDMCRSEPGAFLHEPFLRDGDTNCVENADPFETARSRAEPIYFMKFVKATTEMERSMNQWMVDVHPYTASFEIK